MAFTYEFDNSVTCSDFEGLAASGPATTVVDKVLVDEVLGPAPVTFDLAPRLSSIVKPVYLRIIASGDGVSLKFDGLAAFGVKAITDLTMKFSPDAVTPGLLDIELDILGLAAQRVRVLLIGGSA